MPKTKRLLKNLPVDCAVIFLTWMALYDPTTPKELVILAYTLAWLGIVVLGLNAIVHNSNTPTLTLLETLWMKEGRRSPAFRLWDRLTDGAYVGMFAIAAMGDFHNASIATLLTIVLIKSHTIKEQVDNGELQ